MRAWWRRRAVFLLTYPANEMWEGAQWGLRVERARHSSDVTVVLAGIAYTSGWEHFDKPVGRPFVWQRAR